MPQAWGPFPNKIQTGNKPKTFRKSFQEQFPGFGKMNVDQSDPEIRKRAQPLVSPIELNATSKVSSRENERRSK